MKVKKAVTVVTLSLALGFLAYISVQSFWTDIHFNNPLVYLPEIMGLVILIIFGLRLLKKRMLFKFLSEGITRMPQASVKPG